MAKLRERNDQIEIILERRHVILLGLCALVLGSLLFLLGMLTQRSWLGAPARPKLLAEARKDSPPPLFPNRSAEPNVRGQDFEFYESLSGAQAKARKERSPRKAADASRSGVPVAPAVATTTDPVRNPDELRRAATLQTSAAAGSRPQPAAAPPAKPERAEPRPAAASSVKSATSPVKPADPPAKPERVTAKAESPGKGATSTLKADKSGAYALQVVALSDKSSAQAYLKRLKSKGYPAFVDQARLNGKLLYRVKVGNYGSIEKAQKVAAKLQVEVGKQVLVQRAAEG